MSIPNFDCMDSESLWAFWRQYNRPTLADCRLLFPDTPKGYTRAAKMLANYASNRATAMGCRESGHMETALSYDRICARIYDRLPEFAKW